MRWREKELGFLGDSLSWLSSDDARLVYDDAVTLSSTSRYGLDESRVHGLQRCDATDEGTASAWLTSVLRDFTGHIQVVFGRAEVCIMDLSIFLREWTNMLMPARDDAIIVPVSGAWVLMWCHEELFEFAYLS